LHRFVRLSATSFTSFYPLISSENSTGSYGSLSALLHASVDVSTVYKQFPPLCNNDPIGICSSLMSHKYREENLLVPNHYPFEPKSSRRWSTICSFVKNGPQEMLHQTLTKRSFFYTPHNRMHKSSMSVQRAGERQRCIMRTNDPPRVSLRSGHGWRNWAIVSISGGGSCTM
jgi:hypothetical protein